MTLGQYVAEKYRKQYCKRNKWLTLQSWHVQPEQNYLILLELSSKEAIDALLGNESWTRRLPKELREMK